VFGAALPADTPGMRIREQVVTTASPGRAWELIADVSIHGLWNPHVVDTQGWNGASAGVDSRYRVTYELSGRRNEFEAQIVEWLPEHRFVARLEERVKGDGSNFARYVLETYTIEPRGTRTRVVHDVRIHHDGLPWYFRVLIALIMATGRPVGKPVMQQFAELAEGQGSSAIPPARAS
jgi:hypothetical protein